MRLWPWLWLALGMALSAPCAAQQPTKLCTPTSQGGCQDVGPTNALPVDPGAGSVPSGAATSANQVQEITNLQTLINQAITLPIPVSMTISGGTVVSGGTFQSVLAASNTRKGCLIFNNGANAGKIFAGTTAASHTNYIPLAAGQFFACGGTFTVEVQNIDYTSTTNGDSFMVATW
jgi:hypothetical protein